MKKEIYSGLSILLMTVILFFTGLIMMACPRDEAPFLPTGYSVTLTLDKTEARVGDTVTATVVFRNLIGRDIEAELPGWLSAQGGKNAEDILDVIFTPVGEFTWGDRDIYFEPRVKILIERGAVIERKFEHTITTIVDLEILAAAFFITASCINPNGPGIQDVSEKKILTVQ